MERAELATMEQVTSFHTRNMTRLHGFVSFIEKDNQITESINGSIGDVRIYNRALSAQEIQQLYLMGK